MSKVDRKIDSVLCQLDCIMYELRNNKYSYGKTEYEKDFDNARNLCRLVDEIGAKNTEIRNLTKEIALLKLDNARLICNPPLFVSGISPKEHNDLKKMIRKISGILDSVNGDVK